MAIKVKKKQTAREEAKAPDQILTHTGRVFNFIEKQKVHLLIGLGAVLLVIIVVTALSGHSKRKHNQEGAELLRAGQLLSAPIGEPQENASPFLPVFPTRQARTAAIEEALVSSLTSVQPPVAAELIAAATSLEAGDMAEAELRFQAVARKSTGNPAMVLASEGLASVQAESGNFEAARSTLEQMAQAFPSLQLYTDLSLARLTEAYGDLQAAHDLYRSIADRVAPGLSMPASTSSLIEAARNRSTLLEVLLGLQAEQPAEPPVLPEQLEEDREPEAEAEEGSLAGEATGEPSVPEEQPALEGEGAHQPEVPEISGTAPEAGGAHQPEVPEITGTAPEVTPNP
ncbi:MAG: tetratricopeptide repeat protein [Bradymonadales bacterium]|nr:tetratricopeptide repeat protein [Bradymonadales bacterium]